MVERNKDKGVVKKNVDLFHVLDVQNLLDTEEKEADYSDWYEPELVDFERFVEWMELWMDEKDGAAAVGNGDDKVDRAAAVGDGDAKEDGAGTVVGDAADETDSEIRPSVEAVCPGRAVVA